LFQWLQGRERNFYEAGVHALVKDGGRLSTKMETSLRNNYGLGNVVVKFCKVLSSL
jgi:hypothetical protein